VENQKNGVLAGVTGGCIVAAVPSTRNASRRAALGLRFLGEIEVLRGAQHLALPPSKKTRALLAYLVVTGRPQRRDRLCQMFWDVADDPRAALRWSLSKLRPLVDEPARPRIVATTDTVAFDAADAIVDVSAVRTRFGDGSGVTTAQLQALAAEFRGEFLEGLELPDFVEFRMWCLAQREEARMLHARIVRLLVERLWAQPEDALPYARTLVQVDPLNESALAQLVRLLGASGRRREAEQQYEAGVRLLAELGAELSGELRRAREDVRGGGGAAEAACPNGSPATAPASTAARPRR